MHKLFKQIHCKRIKVGLFTGQFMLRSQKIRFRFTVAEAVFFPVIDRNVFESKSFRSECLKIQANKHCYGEF